MDKYYRLVLSTTPSKTWKAIRFVIHWITIPVKLLLNLSFGVPKILVNFVINKSELSVQDYYDEDKKEDVQQLLRFLPVLNGDESDLYVSGVPSNRNPDGSNHETKDQCTKQGLYVFIKRKLNLDISDAENALSMHIQRRYLIRGFKKNPAGETIYNIQNVSADTLSGLNLGMLNTTNGGLRDKYYELIHSIIDNDYALLAHDRPSTNDPGYKIYMEKYKESAEQPWLIRMKSSQGCFEPGLSTSGMTALTLLASLRIGDKIVGAQDAKKEYKKMLWTYGYGLLGLFSNDDRNLVSLYILSKLADSKFGKLFWKIPMVYVWLLGRNGYNGYYTGLVNDAYPGIVNDSYLQDCQNLLYDKPLSINIDILSAIVMLEKDPTKLL